jgi:hypothetical protein
MRLNSRFHRSSILAFLGAIIAAISPMLPWATIQFEPIQIPNQAQNLILPTLNIPASGFETIIYPTFASFFLVALSIALFTYDERKNAVRGLLFITSGFVMLMTYVYAISASLMAGSAVHDYYILFTSLWGVQLPQNYWPNFSISFGGYVALLGALLTIAGGFWALYEKLPNPQKVEIPPPTAVG